MSIPPSPANIPLPPTPLDEKANVLAGNPTLTLENTPAAPAETSTSTSTALTTLPPPELVLCVFIHGFKGTDSTFGAFPARIGHLVEQVLKVGRGHADNLDDDEEGKPEPERLGGKVTVECLVFPAYEVSSRHTL